MIETICKFDPFDPQDRRRVIEEIFKKYFEEELERLVLRGYTGRTPQQSSFELVKKTTDLEDKLRKLQQSYDVLSSENSEIKEELKNKDQEISIFRKTVSKQDDKIQDKENEIQILKDEINKLHQSLQDAENKAKEEQKAYVDLIAKETTDHELEIKKKDDEYRELQRRLENEKNALRSQNKELQERLQAYVPDIGGEVGEELLYTFDSFDPTSALTQTNDANAPFKVKISSNNIAVFQFNNEKGPSAAACKERDTMLLPFCDIIEGADDPNATSIFPDKWGTAKIAFDGSIRVENIKEKAKIKLSRN